MLQINDLELITNFNSPLVLKTVHSPLEGLFLVQGRSPCTSLLRKVLPVAFDP